MFRVKIIAIAIVVGAVVLALLSYLLPVSSTIHNPHAYIQDKETFQSTLAFLVASTCFNLGGVLLYLLGLRGFTAAFRRTYYLICAGLAVQTIGAIVYLVALYMGALKTDGANVAAELPLAAGMLIEFYGFVKFARLLQISTGLTRLWRVGVGLAVAMVVIWFMPHTRGAVNHNELLFDLSHALQTVETLAYLLAALLVSRIRRVASPLYTSSLRWFMWAVGTAFVASAFLVGSDYLTYPDWLDIDTLTTLFLITNLLTLVSGYAFNKVAHPGAARVVHDNGLLDSVIFLGSLASNPSEIDPLLDRVRVVTANHTPKQPLSATDTQTLKEVYRKLEEYLTTKERIRSFDRQQLTEMVHERFDIPSVPA